MPLHLQMVVEDLWKTKRSKILKVFDGNHDYFQNKKCFMSRNKKHRS